MSYSNELFDIGETVYMKINPEEVGMITGILFRPVGYLYAVTWACDFTDGDQV